MSVRTDTEYPPYQKLGRLRHGPKLCKSVHDVYFCTFSLSQSSNSHIIHSNHTQEHLSSSRDTRTPHRRRSVVVFFFPCTHCMYAHRPLGPPLPLPLGPPLPRPLPLGPPRPLIIGPPLPLPRPLSFFLGPSSTKRLSRGRLSGRM